MNLPVARSVRAALTLLLTMLLAFSALMGLNSPASAAPGDDATAPATSEALEPITDQIPEAVPVTPVPLEVPATLVEATEEPTEETVEPTTTEAPTPEPTDAPSAPSPEPSDEADATDNVQQPAEASPTPDPGTTSPTTTGDPTSTVIGTETTGPATTEPTQTPAEPPAPTSSTEPVEPTATDTQPLDEPAEPTDAVTASSDPTEDGPNADAPVELVEAAYELPEAIYAMAGATTSAEVNVVGVSWDASDQEALVYVRTKEGADWGPWQKYETEEAPDGSTRTGSAPIVVLGADIEVQAAVTYGGELAPAEARLLIVDPQYSPADELAAIDPEDAAAASGGAAGGQAPRAFMQAPAAAPAQSTWSALTAPAAPVAPEAPVAPAAPMTNVNQPVIYSRADWGADESLMGWTPTQGRVNGVIVHHTAGNNGYTASQVPGIIRGIYYYHAVQLDWGDIGYNVVVDTFGRLWEGRAGGLTKPIVGGHAMSWNPVTFGISVLGDFTKVPLPQASMDALARAIAWKFTLHGVNPNGTMTLNGVTRPTIAGHRDVASTACPGSYIYSRMGELRTSVTTLMSGSTLAAAVPLAPYAINPTAASGLVGYDPNYLISDAKMYTPGTMSVSQVQTFLNQQGASCVKGSDGSACIKNATFNTPNRAATAFCPKPYVGRSGESAASIIVNSANACNINPQVLLVILQKEQGLITTTNPTALKYQRATGFACPDFQECSSAYAGFSHQVYSAASRLQQYRAQPASFNYRVGGTYNMLYNPNSYCGTAQVTMKSAATAALYNYTPYVANQASLNAISGTGDSCSAYGNRNFYRYFNLWFGRPNSGAPDVQTPDTPPVNRALLGGSGADVVLGGGTTASIANVGPLTQQWAPRTQFGSAWPNLLAPADWDRNGHADAMLVDHLGNLWFYPRNSSGWLPRVQIGHGWQNIDKVLAGVDWDGDGRTDLLGRHRPTGALWLYRGNGAGGFASARAIGSGWNGMQQLSVVRAAYQGRPALRAVHSNGTLYTYPASTTGAFQAPVVHGGGWGAMVHLAGAGDWTKDGVGDFLAVRNDGALFRYDGVSNGNVRAGVQIGSAWRNWRSFTVANQAAPNGPIWAVNSVGDLYEYRHTYGLTTRPLGLPAGAQPFAGGDWNGDGSGDVLYRASDGALMMRPGRSNGTFGSAQRIGTGWGNFDQVIAVGSWSGNSLPALATYQRSTGQVRIYQGDGQGGFKSSELIGSWPGAKFIFAVGATFSNPRPTVGFVWQNGSASTLGRAADGKVGQPQALTSTWGHATMVIGGFDTDGVDNREFYVVRSDGSISRATSSGGTNMVDRQVSQPGAVATTVS